MTSQIQMVPVDLIDPHPHNPRRDLGPVSDAERARVTPPEDGEE